MIKLKDVIEDLKLGKVYTDKDRPPFQVKEETVNEKVARPFSAHLRKAQDEIEYMISNGPNPGGDESVYDKPKEAMKLLQIAQKSLGKIK